MPKSPDFCLQLSLYALKDEVFPYNGDPIQSSVPKMPSEPTPTLLRNPEQPVISTTINSNANLVKPSRNKQSSDKKGEFVGEKLPTN